MFEKLWIVHVRLFGTLENSVKLYIMNLSEANRILIKWPIFLVLQSH